MNEVEESCANVFMGVGRFDGEKSAYIRIESGKKVLGCMLDEYTLDDLIETAMRIQIDLH